MNRRELLDAVGVWLICGAALAGMILGLPAAVGLILGPGQ